MNENNNLILSSLNKTWIIDLDGTIVKHNGYKIDGRDSFLPGAKEFLKNISKEDMVIFVTSRTRLIEYETELFLKENGIHYNSIIYNAPYGERILINDKKPSGLDMAHSLNLDRDSSLNINILIDESL